MHSLSTNAAFAQETKSSLPATAFTKRTAKNTRTTNNQWHAARLSPLKRTLDLVLAIGLILVLSPVWLTVFLILALGQGQPFFYHKRIGAGGRPFYCIKFRSMALNGDAILKAHLANNPSAQQEWARTFKLKSDPRISPFGAFIRKTSLDEIPQLVNVLKGEMTLVGPRPVVQEEIQTYYKSYAQRCFRQPPGVTGLWQVSARNSVDYSTRVALDLLYMQKAGFWFDLKILFLTGLSVVMRRGQ